MGSNLDIVYLELSTARVNGAKESTIEMRYSLSVNLKRMITFLGWGPGSWVVGEVGVLSVIILWTLIVLSVVILYETDCLHYILLYGM